MMTEAGRPGGRRALLAAALLAGAVFHGLILFLPPGFNADAATESLRCLDALRGRDGLSFTDFHGYRVYLHSLLPLWAPFALFGPHVFPVRSLLLLYDLLAVWGVWRLAGRWLPEGGDKFALVLALFSPWLAEPFSVTVATAAAFPTAGIALAEGRDKKKVLLGHLILGLSFYGYHTARVGAGVYLLLLFVFRAKRLKERAVPLLVTACTVLPAAVMGTLSPSYRKLFLHFGEAASMSSVIDRLRDGFLGWGPGGIACAALFIGALVGLFFWCRAVLRDRMDGFGLVWTAIMGVSLLGALWVAPYLRPRVVLHAAPAVLLACAYLAARLAKRWVVLSWTVTGLICAHGTVVHLWRMGGDRATARGRWDAGVCAAYPSLRDGRADWIYVDCRMDDQLLFLSDRTLPMDDAVFPRTGGATYPWLGYTVMDGVQWYCFWADSPEKEPFRELFPTAQVRWVVPAWGGGRGVEIYRVEHDWTPFQRDVLNRAGRMALSQEALFWTEENDPLKAGTLYRAVLDRYPGSEEAPEAGLRAGICFLQQGRLEEGLDILGAVAERYAGSQEAAEAAEILDRMRRLEP